MRPGRRRLLAAGGALAFGLAGLARGDERVITIVAKKWEYIPAQVPLRRGEAVILELTSLDVAMGFALENTAIRADLMPGQTVRLRLQPDKAGVIGFYCDVFCGSGHEGMDGSLIALGLIRRRGAPVPIGSPGVCAIFALAPSARLG